MCSAAHKWVDATKGLRYFVPTALPITYADAAHKVSQADGKLNTLFQPPPEPGARHLPISLDSGMANAQDLRRLFDRQAPKEFQFDDPALLWIDGSQFLQRFMQGQQIDFRLLDKLFGARDRESMLI